MVKIKLYIAASLDGFIARKDGSLDWLEGLPNPNQIDHGYNAFYESVDTVIMGRATYEEILGFDVGWPYGDSQSFVVTSKKDYSVKTENTSVLSELTIDQMEEIRSTSEKGIWLVGGGQLITAFLDLSLVDEMILSIAPVILGEGIPLFAGRPKETNFKLEKSESFETGIVNLSYLKKD